MRFIRAANGAYTAQDIMNRPRTLTLNTPSGYHPPLTFGSNAVYVGDDLTSAPGAHAGTYSLTLGTGAFPSTDLVDAAFEVWFRPMTTGKILALGYYDTNDPITSWDGLFTDGDNIIFQRKFATAGYARASWPIPDFPEAYHVVGNQTPTGLSLVVNKEVVASVEFTDAQLVDKFQRSLNTLWSGKATVEPAHQGAIIDAPAVYNRELKASEIASHFDGGRLDYTARTIADAFGSALYYLSDAERNILFDSRLTTSEDFEQGLVNNVSTRGDKISPVLDEAGLSQAGDIILTFPINATSSYVENCKIEWDGNGTYTVQASIDGGSNWIAVNNGEVIIGVQAMTPTNPILARITFAGGITDDTTEVRNMRVVAYANDTVRGYGATSSLIIFGYGTTATEPNEVIEQSEDAGFKMTGAESRLRFNPDASEQVANTTAIEMWIRPDTIAGTQTLVASGTAVASITSTGAISNANTTVYVDGLPYAAGMFIKPKRAHHIVVKFATPTNANIEIGATAVNGNRLTGRILMLARHTKTLTDADVARMAGLYSGPVVGTITDSNITTIAEPATPITANKGTWGVLSTA